MVKGKKTRRNFIKKSAIGVGATAMLGVHAKAFAQTEEFKRQKKLPRKVWIATVSQHDLVADILKEFKIKTKKEYLQSAEEAQRMKRTR